MMDIVYICRSGQNEELRYSIRSAEKNLKYDNLWVVGGKPEWYIGKHIPVLQNGTYYGNARNNLETITQSDQISDDFILMNDDFFIVKPVDEIKYSYSGTLKDKITYKLGTSDASMYVNMLTRTHMELSKKGIREPLDYELHVPMIFNKTKLSLALGFTGLWRSIYGNLNSVGGEQIGDVKVYFRGLPYRNEDMNIEETTFLSTEDAVFDQYKEWLQEKFPEPSSCEHP